MQFRVRKYSASEPIQQPQIQSHFFDQHNYASQPFTTSSKPLSSLFGNTNQFNQPSSIVHNGKQNSSDTQSHYDDSYANNPTILRINCIFDSIFGKNHSQQNKFSSKGQTKDDNRIDPPDISSYREKIQTEIEKAVKQYVGTKERKTRILPITQTSDTAKQDSRPEEKPGLPIHKLRYRKKPKLKLYD